MAKYGIDAFKDGQPIKFPIDVEETYGNLTFNGSEVNEKFVYIDDDGEIHERQNSQNSWLAQNTGEITAKFILAYSSRQGDVMDIKVPLDFDLESLTFGQNIELVGADAIINDSVKEEKIITRNGEQIRTVPCKVFPVQVEDVKAKDSKATSQPTQSQSKSEQKSKVKE